MAEHRVAAAVPVRLAAAQQKPARRQGIVDAPRRSGAHTAGAGASSGSALLRLQRTHGNRHVQRVVEHGRAAPESRPELVLGPTVDRYELEADRIARQVTDDGIGPPAARPHPGRPTAVPSHGIRGAPVDPGVQRAVQDARGTGSPLPGGVRTTMERALGADLGGVRLHTDAEAGRLADALEARAFTTGHDVFLGRGEYRPGSPEGRHVLAHELTHVVQQDGAPAGAGTAPVQRLPKFLKKLLGIGRHGGGGGLITMDGEQRRSTRDDDSERQYIPRWDSESEYESGSERDADLTDLADLIDRELGNEGNAEIRRLLHQVATGTHATFSIRLGLDEFALSDHLDLASRAHELDHDAPEGLAKLEKMIHARRGAIAGDRDVAMNPLLAKKTALLTNAGLTAEEKKAKRAKIDAKLGAVRKGAETAEADLAAPIGQYQAIVEAALRREVLKDLAHMSRTDVGRNLLTTLTREDAGKVAINAYHYYKSPDAGSGYVNYTPQYFKDRDLVERGEGGAIPQFEGFAAHNPWQENRRTDITLFHELVHAYHYQQNPNLDPTDLVSTKKAKHKLDRPRDTPEGRRGVSKEEYATVGLGKHKDDEFTENAYRRALQALDEHVALRTQYNHATSSKPAKGRKKQKILV